MISEIRLINYKKFLCERIPLEPITVFIGPNGSGKSTVASALYTIAAIMRLGLKSAFPEGFFSFDRVINCNADNFGCNYPPIGLGISGKTDRFEFDYDIIFSNDLHSPSGFHIYYEGIKVKDGLSSCHSSLGNYPEIGIELPTKGGKDSAGNLTSHMGGRDSLFIEIKENIGFMLSGYLSEIKRYMQRIAKYQFSPLAARMGYEQYNGSGRPFLKPDSANLSEVVQYLQEEHRDLLLQLKKWIIEYAEGESKIVDVGVATYDNKVFLNFYEQEQGQKSFPVRGPLLSDGYWVFAAFACLASSEIMPSVAFFEEPESHLHPHKLPILYEIFKNMAKREKEPCQVLISSHSPYFLDLFKECPDSVVLLNQGRAKRLTDIDDYEEIMSLYPIGEAWYSNIFDWGNP